MGRLERFLAKPEDYELVAEDGSKETIKLEPLTLDELPLLMKAMKIQSAIGEGGKTDFSKVEPDSIEALKDIAFLTLKRSMPEESEITIKKFAFQNFFDMLPKIIEINVGKHKRQTGGAETFQK